MLDDLKAVISKNKTLKNKIQKTIKKTNGHEYIAITTSLNGGNLSVKIGIDTISMLHTMVPMGMPISDMKSSAKSMHDKRSGTVPVLLVIFESGTMLTKSDALV